MYAICINTAKNILKIKEEKQLYEGLTPCFGCIYETIQLAGLQEC